MSLDISLHALRVTEVFEYNITHNLRRMADEAGLHDYLWEPETLGIKHAEELIEPLKKGLQRLKDDPDRFKQFNDENGWGSYEGLVKCVEAYLQACIENKDATIDVWR